MGTKMAPTYGTLVMAILEKQLYDKYEEKYGKTERDNFDSEKLPFLDILICKNKTNIYTDVYYKDRGWKRNIEYWISSFKLVGT